MFESSIVDREINSIHLFHGCSSLKGEMQFLECSCKTKFNHNIIWINEIHCVGDFFFKKKKIKLFLNVYDQVNLLKFIHNGRLCFVFYLFVRVFRLTFPTKLDLCESISIIVNSKSAWICASPNEIIFLYRRWSVKL